MNIIKIKYGEKCTIMLNIAYFTKLTPTTQMWNQNAREEKEEEEGRPHTYYI